MADLAADCLETWTLNHGPAHLDCQVLRCDLGTQEGQDQVLAACPQGVDLLLGAIPCEQVSCARANRPLPAEETRTWKMVAQAIPVHVGRAILRAIVTEWQGGSR